MKKGGGSESTIIVGPSKSVLVYVLHSLEYVLGLARFRVFVQKLYVIFKKIKCFNETKLNLELYAALMVQNLPVLLYISMKYPFGRFLLPILSSPVFRLDQYLTFAEYKRNYINIWPSIFLQLYAAV